MPPMAREISLMQTIMSPEKLLDKARQLQRRAAIASTAEAKAALLKSARELEQKAKVASGDAIVD
jgi:hypothetical protein